MTMVREKSINVFLAAWNVSGSLPATSTITKSCGRFSSRRTGVLGSKFCCCWPVPMGKRLATVALRMYVDMKTAM